MMTYRLTYYEIELLLSFYRDIQKYNDLLIVEKKNARYGVSSEIYAAFKLERVSENTKFSFLSDYCSIIKKAMKSWENDKNVKEYRIYRAIQLMYLGKKRLDKKTISKKINCLPENFSRELSKGIKKFKYYFDIQLSRLNYTQSDNGSIIVDKSYEFEYSRNLELMFYITSNIARESKDYFNKAETECNTKSNINSINSDDNVLKEVS